jgi:sensor histidine kinase YesM
LIFTGNNPDHAAANHNDAQHTGIGLENVRKRIALLYPENSQLTFATENGVFYFRMMLHF